MIADPQFDFVIQLLGLGVASTFEQFCQRKFCLSSTVESFGADRVQFILSRTPLLSLDKIEFKQDESTGFVTKDLTFLRTIDQDNGIIYLPDDNDPGDYWSIVRFTYTGGYWWEMLEPDDDAYPSQNATNAAVLPDDLKQAWLLQCQSLWSQRDKLGLGITDKPEAQTAVAKIELIPLVKQLLGNYVKQNWT